MSLRNFLHKPLRTGLVAIGLAMALALMVMALGWNDVIHYMIDGQFTRVQRENISMSFLRLRPLSVLQELNQIPGVLKAEGVRELPVSLHYRQFNKIMVLQGINPQNQLRQITDSHFDPLPIPTTGLALSRRLQEQWQLKLGDVITFERRDGVPGRYSLPVSAFIDDLLGEGAYLAESELHSLLREEPSLTSAHLSVDPAQLMDVYKQLSQMPQIRSVSLKEFFLKGFNESMGGMIQSFVLILIFFASLMVLGIVFNSVQISFAERSWEFASLRVLGFYPEEVFSILFVEFFLILLLALVPGLVFGHSLTSLSLRLIQSESFHFSLQIYPSSYGLSILAIVASFALSLMLTYFMVKKLKLVEALKARE